MEEVWMLMLMLMLIVRSRMNDFVDALLSIEIK